MVGKEIYSKEVYEAIDLVFSDNLEVDRHKFGALVKEITGHDVAQNFPRLKKKFVANGSTLPNRLRDGPRVYEKLDRTTGEYDCVCGEKFVSYASRGVHRHICKKWTEHIEKLIKSIDVVESVNEIGWLHTAQKLDLSVHYLHKYLHGDDRINVEAKRRTFLTPFQRFTDDLLSNNREINAEEFRQAVQEAGYSLSRISTSSRLSYLREKYPSEYSHESVQDKAKRITASGEKPAVVEPVEFKASPEQIIDSIIWNSEERIRLQEVVVKLQEELEELQKKNASLLEENTRVGARLRRASEGLVEAQNRYSQSELSLTGRTSH